MTPFFHLLLVVQLFVIFILYLKKVKIGLFWGESCETRILSRSIQETHTLRKVKNQVLLFQSSCKPNLSDLMAYL